MKLVGMDKALRRAAALVVMATLAACSSGPSAPSIAIFGSFFPAWIICAVLGVIVAVLVRQLLIIIDLDGYLPVPLLVYLSMAIASGIGLWFLWFGGIPQ